MSTDDRNEPTDPAPQPKCGVPLRIGPPPPGAELEIGPTMTFFGPYGELISASQVDEFARGEPYVFNPYFFNPGPHDEGDEDHHADAMRYLFGAKPLDDDPPLSGIELFVLIAQSAAIGAALAVIVTIAFVLLGVFRPFS